MKVVSGASKCVLSEVPFRESQSGGYVTAKRRRKGEAPTTIMDIRTRPGDARIVAEKLAGQELQFHNFDRSLAFTEELLRGVWLSYVPHVPNLCNPFAPAVFFSHLTSFHARYMYHFSTLDPSTY
jgi:hypothetical protein